jgi:hypothetical protein
MAKSTELILEYQQEGRKSWAIRFYQDGLVREFSDTRMDFENDQIVTRAQPPAWRDLARLSAAELDKLLDGLRGANLFSLPDQIGEPGAVKDATEYTWRVSLDGREKTLLVVGSYADQPALNHLSELIQEVTAEALFREGNETAARSGADDLETGR